MTLDQYIAHLQRQRERTGGAIRVVGPANTAGYVRGLAGSHEARVAKRDPMRLVAHSGEPVLMIDLM